jgi:hypothetical protein
MRAFFLQKKPYRQSVALARLREAHYKTRLIAYIVTTQKYNGR